MKKIMIFLSLGLLLSHLAQAETKCFLATENNKVVKQEGNCDTRYSPRSTFKIAISLMGYDKGILQDENHPVKPYLTGYPDYLESWKYPHTPKLWMQNSCVWFSHVIVKELGMDTFKQYVNKFNYGNLDVAGDKGKDNALTRSWISSSLQISPREQTVFLQQIIDHQLPVTVKAMDMTKNIIYQGEFIDGWKLYGKTGSGNVQKPDGTLDEDLKAGWFVGWLEKDNRKIVFAHYLEEKLPPDVYAGPASREVAKQKLQQMIEQKTV